MLIFIISIFIISFGLLMIFKPKLTLEIENSWRYTSKAEPSNLYIWIIQGGGVVITLMGIVMLIKFL